MKTRPQTVEQCNEYAPGLVLYLMDKNDLTSLQVAKTLCVKKSLIEQLLIVGREQEKRELGVCFAEAA